MLGTIRFEDVRNWLRTKHPTDTVQTASAPSSNCVVTHYVREATWIDTAFTHLGAACTKDYRRIADIEPRLSKAMAEGFDVHNLLTAEDALAIMERF